MEDKILKIKCILCNSINIYKYKLLIYNHNNKLICNDYTNENGCFQFQVPDYGIYKIIFLNSQTNPQKMCVTTLIRKNHQNKITITFNYPSKKKLFLITLTDQNYRGLPIAKGEIILWQNNT